MSDTHDPAHDSPDLPAHPVVEQPMPVLDRAPPAEATGGDNFNLGNFDHVTGAAVGAGARSTVNSNNTTIFGEGDTTPQPPKASARAYLPRTALEQELTRALLDATDEQPTVVLYGLAGTGKSTLGMVVAARLLEDPHGFPGGVLWVDVDNKPDEAIAQELGSLLVRRTDGRLAPADWMRWLWQALSDRIDPQTKARRRSLVVLNGLSQRARIERFLPRIATDSRLLVISDDLVETADDMVYARVQVGPFQREESLRLFGQLIGEVTVDQYHTAFNDIAAVCLDLPESIYSAARTLQTQGVLPPVFARRLLRDERIHNERIEQSLEAVLSNIAPQNAELLDLVSLFGTGRWNAEMLAAVGLRTSSETQAALQEFVQRNLVTSTAPISTTTLTALATSASVELRYELNRAFLPALCARFLRRSAYEQRAAQELFVRYCIDLLHKAREEVVASLQRGLAEQIDAIFVSEMIGRLAADLVHILHALDMSIHNQRWDLVRRFGTLPYLNSVQGMSLNHPLIYVNLTLAILNRLVLGRPWAWRRSNIGVVNVTTTALVVGSSETAYACFPDGMATEQLIREHFVLDGRTRPQIWIALTASALRGAIMTGADMIACRLIGVRADESIWIDTNMVAARFQACDLRGSLWRNCDMHSALLAGCDLRNAVLANVCLRGADLRGADLRGARLMNVDLRGALLDGADLQDAIIRATTMTEASIEDTRWQRLDGLPVMAEPLRSEVQMMSGTGGVERRSILWAETPADCIDILNAVCPNLDLRLFNTAALTILSSQIAGGLFAGMQSGSCVIINAELIEADLRAVTLNQAYIERSRLTRANMRAAIFREARLIGVQFDDALVAAADLSRATLVACDLPGADWDSVNLEGASLCRCTLQRGIHFPGSDAPEQPARLHGTMMPEGERYTGIRMLSGDLDDARTLGFDPGNTEGMARFYAMPGLPLAAAACQRLALRLQSEQPRLIRTLRLIETFARRLLEEQPGAQLLRPADQICQYLGKNAALAEAFNQVLALVRPLIVPATFTSLLQRVSATEQLEATALRSIYELIYNIQREVTLGAHTNPIRLAAYLTQLEQQAPKQAPELRALLLSPAAGFHTTIREAALRTNR